MLTGGPAAYYLRHMKNSRDSKVIFVGYQVEGSPGKILFDTNVYKSEEEEYDVRCKITKFDFSSHAGKGELIKIIRKINPRRVLCVHGDSCPEFAQFVEEETGIPSHAPENGDELEI
jgi:putative mRNA 3-end processing factor